MSYGIPGTANLWQRVDGWLNHLLKTIIAQKQIDWLDGDET